MIAAWLSRLEPALAGAAKLEQSLARVPATAVALTLAAIVVGVGIKWNTNIGGGADAYGYVSQADLWLKGNVMVSQPWVNDVPWPARGWTFSPLGYRLRGVREGDEIVEQQTTLVPTYSPGLPMLMAIAKQVAGHCQMFAVVPITGGLLVLATFGIGRRLGSSGAGLLAAWLIATSPTFLYMLVQPMSDVPVAAAWALALWCLLGGGVGSALAAGLAAGMTILIRPNLAPMVAIAVPWLAACAWRARDKRSVMRTLAYAGGMLPAIVAIAWWNNELNGSPMRSGYGTLDQLYAWENVQGNLRKYFLWLMETQTVVALLGLAALFLPGLWPQPSPNTHFVRGFGGPASARSDRGWFASLLAASTAVLWVQYIFYGEFDAWWFLRFLLAAWPAIFLGTAMLLTWPARMGRRGWATAVLVLAVWLGARGIVMAEDRFAFGMQDGERKYVVVADIVRNRTETRAVILSMQHSGTLRYYGARMTLRYDWLDPEWLDRTVNWLNEHGAHPYAVLETWEVPLFQRKFGRHSVRGTLPMTPLVMPQDVMLFDLTAPAGSAPDEREVIRSYVLPSCVTPRPVPPLVFK
jgi:hypothetical protein